MNYVSIIKFVKRILGFNCLVFLFACHSAKEVQKSTTVSLPSKVMAVRVTVKDSRSLDGCEFLLIKENGEQLQAINLPDSVMIDHMELFVTFVVEKSMSTCMAGQIVRLTGIRKNQ